MKKPIGRPPVKYRTTQMRVEEETSSRLKMLAALSGVSVPELMRQWLLPLVEAELGRRMGIEAKKLAKAGPSASGKEK